MGTILQEMGHDAVIHAFISAVLEHVDLFVVTPALGPKRDIYFRDALGLHSAWQLSRNEYIPRYTYRLKLDDKDMDAMVHESSYKKQEWYRDVEGMLGTAPEQVFDPVLDEIEAKLQSDLPDILGFDRQGKLVLIAEVKFEGFSKKALDSCLKEYEIAKELNIPYYLIIPKNPVYGSEVTDSWLKEHLPQDVRTYKFVAPKESVLPKQSTIDILEVK